MKPINPDVPDKYKYTSDYREIPREYLNPRIPKGRGIVKWNAFKTLPEQYEQLEQYIQDQNKIDRPILDADQLNELNNTLIFKCITTHLLNCVTSNMDILKLKEVIFIK